jgi:TRAP-type transport system periplasmic protein
MTAKRKIRWFIAHHPQELFIRTANAFFEELTKYTDDFELEILDYETYFQQYNTNLRTGDEVNWKELNSKFWNTMYDGDIEMSQRQVGVIGYLYPDFHALDLPFMFETHEHASRVLEGDIGKELCKNLGEKTGVRGLAFTYSGGFRVIGSDNPIESVESLQGKTVVVDNQITLGATMKHMGAEPIVVAPYERDLINAGQYNMPSNITVDAVETTYLRFDGKHVLKTNHSMFLTSIIISKKFWESLTEKEQQGFQAAAIVAAKLEREWSIVDAAQYEVDSEKNGVSIVEISETEQQLMKKKAQLTYVECGDKFTTGLIEKIKSLR